MKKLRQKQFTYVELNRTIKVGDSITVRYSNKEMTNGIVKYFDVFFVPVVEFCNPDGSKEERRAYVSLIVDPETGTTLEELETSKVVQRAIDALEEAKTFYGWKIRSEVDDKVNVAIQELKGLLK